MKYVILNTVRNSFGDLIVTVLNTVTKETEIFTAYEGEHQELLNRLRGK